MTEKTFTNRLPPYTMIGSGNSTKGIDSDCVVDGLALIGSLNHSQLDIFLFLKRVIVINNQLEKKYPNPYRNMNEVNLKFSPELTADIRKLMQQNNNIKTLRAKNILKKGKRGNYMINPYLLIPYKNFARHAQIWKYYEMIDETKGITIEVVQSSMELSKTI